MQRRISSLQTEIQRLRVDVGRLDRVQEEVKQLKEEMAGLKPQPDEYAQRILEEVHTDEDAYKREEPELVKKYAGQFAAYCRGERVAVGPDEKDVTLRAMQIKPAERPYVRKIGAEIPVAPRGRR